MLRYPLFAFERVFHYMFGCACVFTKVALVVSQAMLAWLYRPPCPRACMRGESRSALQAVASACRTTRLSTEPSVIRCNRIVVRLCFLVRVCARARDWPRECFQSVIFAAAPLFARAPPAALHFCFRKARAAQAESVPLPDQILGERKRHLWDSSPRRETPSA